MAAGAVCAVPISILSGSADGTEVVPLGSMPTSTGSKAPSEVEISREIGSVTPRIRVHNAGIEDARSATEPSPRRIQIEPIDLDAPVVPVGVSDGTTEVPDDVDDVGWYRFGPVPGAPGSAVLLSHVDSRTQGPGAFFRLRELVPGDIVSVSFEGGVVRRFEVAARRQYLKERLPEAVFRRSGRPVLTLVTCGGEFDVTTLHYTDNVVVFAVPILGENRAKLR